MKPLVSILIPAFNAERWLDETITSALNQSWSNKEIIVVDDGSTDGTLQLARRYQATNVEVIAQSNSGGAAARNRALSAAQGDFIQWLDHDDLLHPQKIAQQLKHGRPLRDTKVLFSGSFGTFYCDSRRAVFRQTGLWRDLTPRDYFFTKFNENLWIHPSVWLVSRQLTDLAGPWHPLKSPDDDGEYFCRVVAASSGIRFVSDAKSYWRIGNHGSFSNASSEPALAALLESIRLSITHFRRLEDSEASRAACLNYLQSRLWRFYPDHEVLLRKADALAAELGGTLRPPREGRTFQAVSRVFGWRVARQMRDAKARVGAKLMKAFEKGVPLSTVRRTKGSLRPTTGRK